MVKCQGLNEDDEPCGFDLQNAKFCPECGTKVPKIDVAKRKDTVACPGTDEGGPCSNKELPRGQKFCQICFWRVNQSIFEPGSRVCGANSGETRCTGIIRKNETVCPICKSDKGVPQTAVQKDQVNLAKPENQTQPEHGNGQCELSISEPESAQNPSTTATAHGKPASPFHQAETDQDDAASPPKIPRHTEDGCTEMDTAVDEPSTRSRVENETLQGHGMPQHNTDQKSQTSGANLKLLYGAESQTAVDKNIIQGDNSGSVDTEQSTARSHTQPSGSNVQILYGSDNEEASQGTQNPTKNDCYILPQMSNDNVLQNSGSTSEDQSEKSKDNNHGDTWKPTFSLSTTTKKRSEETPTGKASLSDIAEKSDLSSEDSTLKGDDSTEKFPSSSAAITERGDMPVPKPMSEQKGRSDNSSDPPRQSVECTQGVDSSKITESQQQKGIFNFTGGSTQTTGNNTWQNPDRRFGDKSGSIKDDELFGDSNPSGSEEAEKLKSSATGEPSTKHSSLFSLSQNSDKEVNTSSAQTDMDVDVQQQNQDAASLVSKSDGDSESSTDEEDQDDDSSLNQNDEDSKKNKVKEKKISIAKLKREKKRERKRKKKEEQKEKGKTSDNGPSQPNNDNNQNATDGSASGRKSGRSGSNAKSKVPNTSESVVKNSNRKSGVQAISTSNSEKQSNTRICTDTVKVIFHAVFSPSILNDAKGGAYLCLSLAQNQRIRMEKRRNVGDGFVEYSAEYDLPRRLLDKSVYYTYRVDVDALEGVKNLTSEMFYDSSRSHDSDVGRQFMIKEKSLSTGNIHHQYDGIVYGKLESPLYQRVYKSVKKAFGMDDHKKNMKKDLEKLLKFYFKEMLSELKSRNSTPEDFIWMFHTLMQGLSYVYYQKASLWSHSHEFDYFAGKILKEIGLAFTEEAASKDLNIPEHLRLGIIITLIHIIMPTSVFHEKEAKDMEKICLCLQLQPLDKDNLTKLIDDLKSLFPSKLSAVTSTLQQMTNLLCGQTSNASWLLVAPLLHFLSGKSSPYQQPSTDTGHTKKDPV